MIPKVTWESCLRSTLPSSNIVVMHSGIVHDGLVVAEYVEAESFWRAVAVEQRPGEEPRRISQKVAALPHHLHRFRPTLLTGSDWSIWILTPEIKRVIECTQFPV